VTFIRVGKNSVLSPATQFAKDSNLTIWRGDATGQTDAAARPFPVRVRAAPPFPKASAASGKATVSFQNAAVHTSKPVITSEKAAATLEKVAVSLPKPAVTFGKVTVTSPKPAATSEQVVVTF